MVHKVTLCGFDSMASRKTAFNVWLLGVQKAPQDTRKEWLFIDGRLNAEEFQVFCIQGDDDYAINRYRQEYLFDDSEVEDLACSYKQTSFMANMIASVMVNLLVNFASNRCDPVMPRDLPFKTSYQGDYMVFKTEN